MTCSLDLSFVNIESCHLQVFPGFVQTGDCSAKATAHIQNVIAGVRLGTLEEKLRQGFSCLGKLGLSADLGWRWILPIAPMHMATKTTFNLRLSTRLQRLQ